MRILIAMLTVLPFASFARGQSMPFYYATPTLVDPEISYATSGADTSIQHTVASQDRKYVTLDIGAENSTLLGFQQFQFQNGLGFVGSPAAVKGLTAPQNRLITGLTPPARNALTPTIARIPTEIAPTPTVLEKPGMTQIGGLTGTNVAQ